MAENQTQQLLVDFLNAFYAGDVERALTYCDDEIDFLCYAPIDILPHLGHKHGKTEMLATWKTLHERYASMRHELPFIVAENDKAAVIIRVYFRKRDSDRIVQLDIADFYTLRNGRILEIRQFLDSFDVVEQVLERDVAAVLTGDTDSND